jgi:microcin C transport system substrate-binding protein
MKGVIAAVVVSATILTGTVAAVAQEWRTVSSLIESEEPQQEFTRFPYVNPNAPKGGTLNSVAVGTFDSFNPFIAIGTSAAGLNFQGGLLWDTLMQRSRIDEPGYEAMRFIAEAFSYPARLFVERDLSS